MSRSGGPRPREGSLRGPPELTIVIVSYECREHLRHCLDSLLIGAAGLTFETIVIDNASTDGTVEWLRQQVPDTQVIANPENRGFARACNQGIRAASGEYVLLLNPDTTVEPGTLRCTRDYLRRERRLAAASCKVVRPDGRLDPSCKREFPTLWDAVARFSGLSRLFPNSRLFARYDAAHLDEDRRQEVPLIDGCYMMIRREAFDSIGLLDERFYMYAEEMDWCRRAHEAGWGIGYDPSGSIVHLKGEISRHSTFRMLYHFHRSMALYHLKFRRWWSPAFLLVLPGIVARWILLTLKNAALRERRVSG